MEIPIQVACRIAPIRSNESHLSRPTSALLLPLDEIRHESDAILTGIDGLHAFSGVPIHLPRDCTQDYVYHQTVYPMLATFLEGFDVSFVTYGQQGTGKTYTMLGPGLDCVFSERDQGIIQRCVRDIFVKMGKQRERSYVINIGWVEIVGDEIHDLLDEGTVQCLSIGDVFHYLKIGLHNRSTDNQFGHSLFTVTMEQRWTNSEGLIQHRLSTASFCDLCATERMLVMNSVEQHVSVPKDLGLQALERIVHALNDPNCLMVDYNQTTLTTLLKDSFGGRAQTLFYLCVSPFEECFTETEHNFQFAYKVQCVRNFVVLNTFSDNNTVAHVANEVVEQPDTFGLQFAASQWLKLVSNAEGLFTKLITSKSLNEQDRERIEEWIFLKQECEECLSSGEINMAHQRHLGPIQEADEQDETSDQETSCIANTDPDSDSESQHPDVNEKIDSLMEEFQYKTDLLVRDNYNEFVRAHPKAMLESNDSFRKIQEPIQDKNDSRSPSPSCERRQSSSRYERRKSYQPDGLSVSSMQLEMLNRVASKVASRKENSNDFLSKTSDVFADPITKHNALEVIQKKLNKVNAELEALQKQIEELKKTIALKKKLITDLNKAIEASETAKQNLNKQMTKRKAEYEKCLKNLEKAKNLRKAGIAGGETNVARLEVKKAQLEVKLKNLKKTIGLTDESEQNIKHHKKSLKVSQKELDELNDAAKRNKKIRDALEHEMRIEKSKINKDITSVENNNTLTSKALQDQNARICAMNHRIKQKSMGLEQVNDSQKIELFRHEIRQLREFRDKVLKEKSLLMMKLKDTKTMSQFEERKLLEYEESVEVIDHIVEYKNELICGRKSADTDESLQLERGQQMLVDKWNNLPAEEMRTLLYKYFQKAIDLRDSTGKLEQQLMSLERERDAWECRERALINAIRQARLEGESHALLLQQQHETKVTLMLRQLADETSTSSSMTDRYVGHHQHRPNYHGNPDDSATSCRFGLDIYKPSIHHKQMIKTKAPNMDLYPISDGRSRYKYRPFDKITEKSREGKNNSFANFFGFGVHRRKVQDSSMSIPEQNLKQLQASQEPVTKVTREKNKIIIQQDGKHNGHRH